MTITTTINVKRLETHSYRFGFVLTYLSCLNGIYFKGITYVCYTYSELVTHFKCKYFDCLFVISALPYPLLLYTIFMLAFCITLCYAIQFF